MVVVRQSVESMVAFSTELSDSLTSFLFVLTNREDLTVKSFTSVPLPEDKRNSIFEWFIVDSAAQENIPANRIFLNIGQYDYVLEDVNGKIVDTGLIRVDSVDGVDTKEYEITETFKVYGKK